MNSKTHLARFFAQAGNKLASVSRRLAPSEPALPANRFLSFFYPGHFYSPIPDPEFVDKNAETLFKTDIMSLPGIDDNWPGQLELLRQMLDRANDYQPLFSRAEGESGGARFFSDNTFFKEFDTFVYCDFLRRFQPRQIVEVGSGFTSALALDVAEKFIQSRPRFVFIEPFPDRLRGLIKPHELANISIHERPVQQVDKSVFKNLGAGDFLFVDSSHVSKIGSDVNFLFLDVLPELAQGVIVHIHDIFWPFEYPKAWLDEGRIWNEAYLLRGMLAHSSRYRILFFNSEMKVRRPEMLQQLPDWAKPGQAQSIWLEVVA